MSLLAIRRALETQLLALTPAIETAAENVAFEPKVGTPHQRIHLLPNNPSSPTLGTAELIKEQGILQVSLYYPQNTGTKAALERAEAIRGQFPKGLTLTSGGVNVTIAQRGSIAPAVMSDAWYVVPVSIPYFSWLIP